MPIATRLKGNQVPIFTLKIGAGSAVDFGSDLVSFEFVDGDGAQVTFSDFADGTPTQLNATFVTDFSATAAFEYLYANAGTASVTYSLQPAQGAVSQTNPKFTGTLTLPSNKPRWGNTGGQSTDYGQFDVEFALDTYTKAIS